MTFAAVLLHGFPETGVDPLTQLDSLRVVCNSHGLSVRDFRWSSVDRKEILRLLLLLRRKDTSFTDVHAEEFGNWIGDRLQEFSDDTELIIIAFSAGGAIFYKWVLEWANADEIEQIHTAIVVAAPHTFPAAVRMEQHPGTPFPVSESPISAGKVETKLSRRDVQLKVFLGGKDITIPAQYGRFPTAPNVYQEVIPDATHETIRDHPKVVERVESWLSEL